MPTRPSLDAPYWLALLSAGPLDRRVAKRIVRRWCIEEGQPLSALFRFPKAELARGLNLTDEESDGLMASEQLVPDQAKVVDELASMRVGVLTRADVAYPETLVERLPEERLPYVMFYRGNLTLLTQPAVAILGASDPSEEARAVAEELSAALAADRHHLVGGYGRGIDRLALDRARESGGRTTLVLPIGIKRFRGVMKAWEEVLESGRMLVLSPLAPDAPHTPVADRARLTMVAALAEVLVMISPELAPSDVLPGREGLGRGLFVWADPHDTLRGAWRAAGAVDVGDAHGAHEAITGLFGVAPSTLDEDAGGIDDLAGVEPIEFEDPDSAIEMLGRTGAVPDVLAHRLRERHERRRGDDDA